MPEERNPEAWLLATSRFPRSTCACGQPVWYHWMDDPKGRATAKRMRMIANCSGVHGVAEIEEEYERLVAEAVIEKMEQRRVKVGVDPAGYGSGFVGFQFAKASILKSRYTPGQPGQQIPIPSRTPASSYQQIQQLVQSSGRAVHAGQPVYWQQYLNTPSAASWNSNAYPTYGAVNRSGKTGDVTFWLNDRAVSPIRDPGALDGPDGLEARLSDTVQGWAQNALDELTNEQPDLSWGASRRQLAEYLAPKIRKPRWRKEWSHVSWYDPHPLPMFTGATSGYEGLPYVPLTDHFMNLRSIHPVLREDLRSRALLLRESKLSLHDTAAALQLSVYQLQRLLRRDAQRQPRAAAEPDFTTLVSGPPSRNR